MNPGYESRLPETVRELIFRGFAAAAIGCLLFAAGCSGTPNTELSQEAKIQNQNTAVNKDNEFDSTEKKHPYIFPLTGLPSEKEVKDRPVMVMVENSPAARPQSGLDQADIVYEILAEGEITRFAAFYQSQSPKAIGPVRSIRPYYVEVGEGHSALLVHAGWSQAAMDMLSNRKLPHFDEVYGDHKYYWRDEARKAPHNLYTSIEKIRLGAQEKKYSSDWSGPSLKFAGKDQPIPGKDAVYAKINYIRGYSVEYEYDTASRTYKRFMEGRPHLDKESGKQIEAANILIIESKHRVLDNEGRRDVDVHGPGKGYLMTQGKMREIAWERKGGVIRAYEGNSEIGLTPGKTWIQVVPEGSEIGFQDKQEAKG